MFDNELICISKNDDGHSGNDDINMQSGTKSWTQTFLTQIGLIENRAFQRKSYQYAFCRIRYRNFRETTDLSSLGFSNSCTLVQFWKNSREEIIQNCVGLTMRCWRNLKNATLNCVYELTCNTERWSRGSLSKLYQRVVLEDDPWAMDHGAFSFWLLWKRFMFGYPPRHGFSYINGNCQVWNY